MRRLLTDPIDRVALAGLAILALGVTVGFGLIYPPAAFIAFGVVVGGPLLWYAVQASRSEVTER